MFDIDIIRSHTIIIYRDCNLCLAILRSKCDALALALVNGILGVLYAFLEHYATSNLLVRNTYHEAALKLYPLWGVGYGETKV